MLSIILIYYLLGKTSTLIITVLSFLLSVFLYTKAMKSYYPRMKSKEKQHFHDDFPEFMKYDLHLVSFPRIFFGILTFFWIRIILFTSIIIVMFTALKIFFLKRDYKKPLSKEDSNRIKGIVSFLSKGLVFATGVVFRRESKVDCLEEYKKFLGNDYVPPENFGTYISNHTCWLDIFYIASRYAAGFVSKETIRKIPFFGFIALSMQSTFLDRTNKEKRAEAFKAIMDRQTSIMKGENYNQLGIFPEGTNTNGKYLIAFKIGSFASLTPLKPMYMKNTEGFYLTTGGMNLGVHFCLTMCFLYHTTNVFEMPVFAPTEYLFENYKHLGKDKGEIYMEAMREIMSRVSGIPKSEASFLSKLEYLSMIKGKTIKNT